MTNKKPFYKRWDMESWLHFLVLAALAVVGIGWLIVNIYQIINPQEQQPITFEVTGIVNSSDPGTLVQLHYECIKYCIDKYGSSGYTKDCYDQCALLGKEVCDGK